MRLYKQELLRIMKSTRTRVIVLAAISVSVLLAVVACEFNDAVYLDKYGNEVSLHGIPAVHFIRDNAEKYNGEVTVDKLKNALITYQNLYEEYGVDPFSSDFPLDTYWEKIQPIRPMLRLITQAYGPATGIDDLRNINADELDTFYNASRNKLSVVLQEDEVRTAVIQKAQKIYDQVSVPFCIYHGYTIDSMDYIEFAILIMAIMSAAAAAPVFSERYSSGEDSILRCTLYGRGKLITVTILAELTVVTCMFFIGMGLHLFISDRIFGFETLKESVQSLYTVYSLPDMNLFVLQILLVLVGWIGCMAVTVVSLYVSARVSDTSTSMVISLILVFLPTLLYSFGGGPSWLVALFPSASVGLNNNMLMSLVDLRFLTLGDKVFWYPAVLVFTAVIGFFLFALCTHIAYKRHQVTK